MLWDLSIPISEKMYQISGPIIKITRCFGLCPLTVHKQGSKLFLKWSPIYAAYSIILGIVIIALTYRGFLADVNVGKDKSIRIRSQADMFVTFFDINVVVSVAFYGIFIMPFKFATFCKLVTCLNQVDARIPPTNVKYSKYLSITVICTVLFLALFLQVLDTAMYFETVLQRNSEYFIIKCYIFFYVCYLIMLLSLCQYWHLVYGILRRIKLLNTHLKIENFVNQPPIRDFNILTLRAPNAQKQNVRKVFENPKQDLGKSELNICKLMVVYEKICDAVDLLNDLFGFNCALLIVGVLWHLIITFHCLIQEILGSRKDAFYFFVMSAWNCIHIMRLLFIAEPCDTCILQIQQTKNLVCTLLSSTEVDSSYKPKFQEFALILTNRKFEFTATGLAIMDRSLVTSIIGAVTTYLVLLIQFTQSEKTKKATTEVTIAMADASYRL